MNQWVDLKLVLFEKTGKQIPFKDPLYEILNRIKIPPHLTDIEIKKQPVEDIDSNLIFVGKDSKGRKQYYYGKDHVTARAGNKIKVLLSVDKKKDKVYKFIEKNLKNNSIDHDYLFAVFLSIELKFFIRMGKEKYYKDNQTIGMNTMTKQSIIINDKKIIFNFVGKVGVEQNFSLSIEDPLAEHILKIYNNPNNNIDFFFVDKFGKRMSENTIYDKMKPFKIKLKDLRTYGVNKIFIDLFIKEIKKLKNPLDNKTLKSFFKELIKETAQTIGHSEAICKKSYLVTEIIEVLKNDWFFENKKKLTPEIIFDKLKFYIESNKSGNQVDDPESIKDLKEKFTEI